MCEFAGLCHWFHVDNMAAWVQAIGTFAAIGAAYWIGNRQEQRRELSEKTRRDVLGRILAAGLYSDLQEMEDHLQSLARWQPPESNAGNVYSTWVQMHRDKAQREAGERFPKFRADLTQLVTLHVEGGNAILDIDATIRGLRRSAERMNKTKDFDSIKQVAQYRERLTQLTSQVDSALKLLTKLYPRDFYTET